MAADQLENGRPLDRAYACWSVHARIDWLVAANCSRINLGVGISLRGRVYLRGAIPGVCKHRAYGTAYAGVRRAVRPDHAFIAVASYATRAWIGNFRIESAKAGLGADAESDDPHYFWPGSLLLLDAYLLH